MPRKDCRCLHSWRSKARFIFKVFLVIGFCCQSYQFLAIYLYYPAIVELGVFEPSEFELPAVTVCNANEIRSTIFCERYPDRCGNSETDPSLCVRFYSFCKLANNGMQVPIVDPSTFLNLTRYEQQAMGHTFERFVQSCTIQTDVGETNCTKPLLFAAKSFSNKIPFNCFTINSLKGKPSAKPTRTATSTKIHLILNLESDEYHPSHLSRGAQLSVHTPYHIPSPANDGYFLNQGNIYRLSVKLLDKRLLRRPFKSNCSDYIQQWKANGGEGPVTEHMCKEKCKLDLSLEKYNCADYRIDYPHNETYCPEAMDQFLPAARQHCGTQCASPCKMRKYTVQIQEASSGSSRRSCMDKSDPSCLIIVHISFDHLEVTTFTYTATFNPIEILGFLGGYVGLWLGISLLTVYDFIETRMFKIFAKLRRKISKKNKNIAISNSISLSAFNRRLGSKSAKQKTLFIRNH